MELSFYLPKGSYATELIGDFTLIFKCFFARINFILHKGIRNEIRRTNN